MSGNMETSICIYIYIVNLIAQWLSGWGNAEATWKRWWHSAQPVLFHEDSSAGSEKGQTEMNNDN